MLPEIIICVFLLGPQMKPLEKYFLGMAQWQTLLNLSSETIIRLGMANIYISLTFLITCLSHTNITDTYDCLFRPSGGYIKRKKLKWLDFK